MGAKTKDEKGAGKNLDMVWHGVPCVADELGEGLRHSICLCWRCARLVTEGDIWLLAPTLSSEEVDKLKEAYNCPTAQENYENCRRGYAAAPITRCFGFLAGRVEYGRSKEK